MLISSGLLANGTVFSNQIKRKIGRRERQKEKYGEWRESKNQRQREIESEEETEVKWRI